MAVVASVLDVVTVVTTDVLTTVVAVTTVTELREPSEEAEAMGIKVVPACRVEPDTEAPVLAADDPTELAVPVPAIVVVVATTGVTAPEDDSDKAGKTDW